MPEPSNTSFIPKRNPVKNARGSSPRPVFIGTLLIRAFFFAVLIAALVVFIYENRLNSQLDKEITTLNNLIATFSEVDMKKVQDANERLKLASDRLQYTASIRTIFEAVEDATVQTVQIDKLDINRLTNTEFEVVAKMRSGTFDSIIFQRGVMERSDKLIVSSIDDLVLNNPETDQGGSPNDIEYIDFRANLSVLTENIPHNENAGGEFRNVNLPTTPQTVPDQQVQDLPEEELSDEVNQQNSI